MKLRRRGISPFEIFKAAHNEGAKVFGLATGSSPIGYIELLKK